VTATAADTGRVITGDRNPVVDLVCALALVAVVLGHWLKQGWYVDASGTLHRAGLLGIAPWTHPLTWVFQVMPLFFLVGGYVNALWWRHARERGIGYGPWLAGRIGRLTRPLLPLLAFWVVVVPLAPFVGLDGEWLRIASLTSLVPTWFLAVYVVVVALVPLTLAAWDRWGLWTLVGASAAALFVVGLSLGLELDLVGDLNVLLVWGAIHQAGYAWRDGALARRSHALLLAVGGLAATLAVVTVGPYGVSMVGVDGFGVNNTNPPRITILSFGLAMIGLVLLAEPVLQRLAVRPRIWSLVVLLDLRMMTVYLWHLAALPILGALSLWLAGIGLHDFPDSGAWWAWRPAWLAALALTTVGLVAMFGRFENPVQRPTHCVTALPVLEVLAAAVLLGILADRGLGPSGAPWFVVAGTLMVLGTLDRLFQRESR